MYTDQPLYRARAFEPAAGLNDVVCLLDAGGLVAKSGGPYFQVAGVEPVKLSPASAGGGSHGVCLLYTQAATVPAGYALVAGGFSNQNLAAGGSLRIVNSTTFQQGPKQLLQARFKLVFTGVFAGVKESDIDLQLYSPGSQPRFGTANAAPGFLNSIDEMQSPGNVIDDPAQNVNATLPAVFPAVHPRDDANFSEFWIWEINGPTFVVINNGVAAMSGGSVGIRLWGYRYDLVPLPEGPDANGMGVPYQNTLIFGKMRRAPAVPKIIFIPTAPYPAGQSYTI